MKEALNPIAIAPVGAPPAFIWHTETDKSVKMESTLKYAAKLHSLDTRCEMHIYPEGWHGMGLAKDNPVIRRWSSDLAFWLSMMGYLNADA